jgi:hypothetical protein
MPLRSARVLPCAAAHGESAQRARPGLEAGFDDDCVDRAGDWSALRSCCIGLKHGGTLRYRVRSDELRWERVGFASPAQTGSAAECSVLTGCAEFQPDQPLDPTALSLRVFYMSTVPASAVSPELALGRRAVAQWARSAKGPS